MRIVIYESASDGAVARIETLMPRVGKRPARLDWLPVAIHGADATDARAKAQAFWDTELERIRRQSEVQENRVENLRKARAERSK